MIVIVAAWLVREFQQVATGKPGGTFSNLVWVLLGSRYGRRWFTLMGAVTGLLVWLFVHFGWHYDAAWLVGLVSTGSVAGLVLNLIIRPRKRIASLVRA